MQTLSAVIIVHNEEKQIADCLEQIKHIVDEIVILDSFSTDKTIEICKRYTTKIFQQEFKGFGEQKQDAVNKSSHDWILQIDADERLSPALIRELSEWKKLTDVAYAGYVIPFHVYFMGKRMRFGGCSGEFHVRLFNKKCAHYGKKKIHEGIQINGLTGIMNNHILHESYASFDEYFRKSNIYTSLIAQEKYETGRRFHVWQIMRFPFEFIVRYVIKLGFLDGFPGFVYALISSYYAVMKHLKLWEIERRMLDPRS